jgi:hypothetical protein
LLLASLQIDECKVRRGGLAGGRFAAGFALWAMLCSNAVEEEEEEEEEDDQG